MKKRMVPVVVAVIIALSLTACGKDKIVSSTEVSESTVSSVEEKEEADKKETPAEEEAVTEADTEAKEDTSIETGETEEEDIAVFGKVEDGTYTNDFFGVTITPAEEFTLADDSKLALLNNFTREKLAHSDSDVLKFTAEQVKAGKNVVDVYLSDAMGVNSLLMNVAYIGFGVDKDFAYSLAELSAKSAEELYASQGFDVQSCEVVTIEISGIEVPCVKTVAKRTVGETEIDTYMLQAILIKDGYGATITSGTYFSDESEEQFKMVTLSE